MSYDQYEAIGSFQTNDENAITYARVAQVESLLLARGFEPSWVILARKAHPIQWDKVAIKNDKGEVIRFYDKDAAIDYYQENIKNDTVSTYSLLGEEIFDAFPVATSKALDHYYVRYLSRATGTYHSVMVDDQPMAFDSEIKAWEWIENEVFKLGQNPLTPDQLAAIPAPEFAEQKYSGAELLEMIGKWFDAPEYNSNAGRVAAGDKRLLNDIVSALIYTKYGTSHHETVPFEFMVRDTRKQERFIEYGPPYKFDVDDSDTFEQQMNAHVRYYTAMISQASDHLSRISNRVATHAREMLKSKEETDG